MSADDERVHIPVLARELLEVFEWLDGREGFYVDATVGAGGHAALLLERYPELRLVGIDQDPEILEVAGRRLARFGERAQLYRCRISDLSRLLRKERLSEPLAVLMDVGASSLQLDRPERGFSFMHDGPLDMRMDPTRERTAAEIINDWDESDLADLLFFEGDEPQARRVARAIVEARRNVPFRRTAALADLIERVVGRRGKRHPATRSFQALRRAVNCEGEELRAGLEAAEQWLPDGGLLAVMSFHSGEDSVVKRFVADGEGEGRWRAAAKGPLRPTREEERRNPRARSARLRAAIRLRGEREPELQAPDEEDGE